jgi:phospholipid/cholesterol/gamma-HCH transport system ATP-binding protein
MVEGTIEDMLAYDDPWVQAYFKGKRARSIVPQDSHATADYRLAQDSRGK